MRYPILIPLFLLILATPLQAAEYEELYQSEVEVSSRSAAARNQGMRQAMTEVLIKVSGTERIVENADLAQALDSASRYVQQYQYFSASETDGTGGARLMLSVHFDQKGIDDLLRRHASSVFGGGSGTMMLEVIGVESLKQYRRVVDYLSAMREVTGVLVDRVNVDTIRLSLQFQGTPQTLRQVISQGNVLAAAPRRYQQRYQTTYPGAAQVSRTPGERGAPLEAGPPVITYHLLP